MGISYRDLAESRNLRNDDRLGQILHAAAKIMAEEGYERATIRKVAQAVDGSIASLYYYFKSKEELLFHIQVHTFKTLCETLEAQLAPVSAPYERIRILIRNHLGHYFRHLHELKVCSLELETLTGEYAAEVERARRKYFRLALDVVLELCKGVKGRRLDPRLTTLNLFGMLNWIHTWYTPEGGVSERRLTNQITNLFLNGIQGS